MMYLLFSLLMIIFVPEMGEGFADVLRETLKIDWHGYWFWVIGLFTIGMMD